MKINEFFEKLASKTKENKAKTKVDKEKEDKISDITDYILRKSGHSNDIDDLEDWHRIRDSVLKHYHPILKNIQLYRIVIDELGWEESS